MGVTCNATIILSKDWIAIDSERELFCDALTSVMSDILIEPPTYIYRSEINAISVIAKTNLEEPLDNEAWLNYVHDAFSKMRLDTGFTYEMTYAVRTPTSMNKMIIAVGVSGAVLIVLLWWRSR